MGYVSTWMGDLCTTHVSDGFAALFSRPKPFLALFPRKLLVKVQVVDSTCGSDTKRLWI